MLKSVNYILVVLFCSISSKVMCHFMLSDWFCGSAQILFQNCTSSAIGMKVMSTCQSAVQKRLMILLSNSSPVHSSVSDYRYLYMDYFRS